MHDPGVSIIGDKVVLVYHTLAVAIGPDDIAQVLEQHDVKQHDTTIR